jgi:NAD(P)-dependent dehydrogenase (short-subunit alcohol dehydrogenase family)
VSPHRKVVVTGASSGIGRATALRFAADGYDVCLNARRATRLEELVAQFPPGDHLVCAGDYSDPAVVEAIGKKLRERWGRVDVLVNCAGISQPAEAIDSPLEEWRQPFDMMFAGGVRITRLAVPLMSSGGRIIHITSIHGERAEAKASAYAMAKAALNQFCRVLAVELAPRGILVNAIAPGFIETPMTAPIEAELRQQVIAMTPIGRFGEPREIAAAALFLASDDGSFMVGQIVSPNGGYVI